MGTGHWEKMCFKKGLNNRCCGLLGLLIKENDYETVEKEKMVESEALKRMFKQLEQEVSSLQLNQSELLQLQKQIQNQIKSQNKEIEGCQQDIMTQSHDIDKVTKDITSINKDVLELKNASTRYTSRSSSRRTS